MKNTTIILRLILTFTLCLGTLNLKAQPVQFSHLTTDEGLSQCSVNGLYIDEHGAVWIATREGLNRYNGHSVVTHRLEKGNPNSLFCNSILRITGNGNGMLYLVCAEGIAQYDMRQQSFTTIAKGSFNSIFYDKELYVGRLREVLRYDSINHQFSSFLFLKDSKREASCLYRQDNQLYVGTMGDGLFCYDTNTKEVTHPIKQGRMTNIYCDSKKNLWIGSWDDGLFRIAPNGEITNFRHNPKEEKSIASNFVRACCEDNLGQLWIGTMNGLDQFQSDTEEFRHSTVEQGSKDGLTHSSVWCIQKDRQGTLWLGTYFGGVNYFNPEYEIFTRYTYNPNPNHGLSYPVVGPMVEDRQGNLWIGTEGGGVNYLNRKERTFKWYRAGTDSHSLSHNNIKALYYDAATEELWIGTHLGGLNRLHIPSGKITVYRAKEGDPHTLPSNIVRYIIPCGKEIIVATQMGVCLLHPSSGRCKQLQIVTPEGRQIKTISSLALDQQGKLWIAANGEGVIRYNLDSDQLTYYRHHPEQPGSLSSNNVNNILCDSKGNLWFSMSGSGLDRYLPETDSFENYDQQQNGLLNDCVYRAEEATRGEKILLTTNGGFSILDLKSKLFTNYNPRNGFPLSSINENSLCVTRDGEIFLGSTQGMISFYEESLDFSFKPYEILLNRLIVNGKEIKVNDETQILSQALEYTKEITLNADQSMFSIEFSTSNYVVPNKDELLYKLEGFSPEWRSTLGSHTITYTNLSPGSYRLLIKPAHADKLCQPAILMIRILPPIYITWWAILLYILIGGTLLWFLFSTYQARIKLKASLDYEQQHLRDIEQLNQSKLRFFTNISHEFRTPLTLIVSQVETLMQMQNYTPSLYNKLLSVYKNSLQLRELISELLDFRKQEQGHMKIKVERHHFVDFLYENYLLFNAYAESKKINLHFEKLADDVMLWYDQKQMQKVVNNLLSNAFKHCQPNDSITLGLKTDGQAVTFWVEDTGCGIAADDLVHLFERFYQVEGMQENKNGSSGTGIGLALTKGIVELHHGTIRVESELNKGTRFKVTLPLGNSHFTPDQISHEEATICQTSTPSSAAQMQLMEELEENSPKKHIPDVEMLVVEDNDELRNMLCQLFAPFYHVVAARDGEEAWEMIGQHAPHIVVSDVMMPRLSGTALCQRIKSDYQTCHIPVVLLTARTAIEQNIEGLRMGADDYITKPFHSALLISRCNNLVNSRALMQEKFSHSPQVSPQLLATNQLDKELLDKATRIIEMHLDDANFSVNLFAREIGMARTNLFAKIKAITGQTPNDFIQTIRLKRGAQMLRENPELNITEIADKIGFSSARYFAKCFKEVYHLSPMKYRKGTDEEGDNEEEE